jgi:hypothetical protein
MADARFQHFHAGLREPLLHFLFQVFRHRPAVAISDRMAASWES